MLSATKIQKSVLAPRSNKSNITRSTLLGVFFFIMSKFPWYSLIAKSNGESLFLSFSWVRISRNRLQIVPRASTFEAITETVAASMTDRQSPQRKAPEEAAACGDTRGP